MKLRARNKGVDLFFDEKEHIYSLKDGTELISATTFISEFFPKFDTQEISRKYAQKHGLDQLEVIERWQKEADEASAFGNKIHDMAELYLKSNLEDDLSWMIDCEKDRQYEKSLRNYLENHFFKRYDLIEAEKIVFSIPHLIAGTMDILAREKSTGKIVILDWKTNKVIEKYNSFNQMGLAPISHLDDTNFFKYAIQLNLYERLLRDNYENYHKEDIDRRILHITPDKVLTYLVPDFQDEVNLMIIMNQSKKSE